MSTTTRALTNRHRAQQLLLRQATQAAVVKLWPALSYNDLDATYPILDARLSVLVAANRLTSAGLSSAYVRQFRAASGVRGNLDVHLGDKLDRDQFNASLQSTSIAAVKRSTSNGVSEMKAMQDALTQVSGSMARLVLNGGRDTITQTTVADRASAGWQRVLGGGGCDFCQMLADRSDVYSEESANFEAHDHCGCSAEPVYH